jgi:hypothetical protein
MENGEEREAGKEAEKEGKATSRRGQADETQTAKPPKHIKKKRKEIIYRRDMADETHADRQTAAKGHTKRSKINVMRPLTERRHQPTVK